MGRRTTPLKLDWEKNIVYLYQFPRARCAPSISPFALKVETWLRMAEIEYKNVDCGLRTRSMKGQIPFVELNGREIADSNMIISLLSTIFRSQVDKHLYEADLATARAYASMVENSLFWVTSNMRLSHMQEIFGERGMRDSMSKAMRPLSPMIAWLVARKYHKKLLAQGSGVHSVSENIEMGKKDLRALSIFLDHKKYLTGLRPCSADATVFGHLVQLWYVPVHSTPLKQYIATECPNLVDYIERMKAEFWPDWEEVTTTLSMHTYGKKSENRTSDLDSR